MENVEAAVRHITDWLATDEEGKVKQSTLTLTKGAVTGAWFLYCPKGVGISEGYEVTLETRGRASSYHFSVRKYSREESSFEVYSGFEDLGGFLSLWREFLKISS